jgi:hypothetical protein
MGTAREFLVIFEIAAPHDLSDLHGIALMAAPIYLMMPRRRPLPFF